MPEPDVEDEASVMEKKSKSCAQGPNKFENLIEEKNVL